MTAEITWTHNLERVFGNLDAHGAHVRQRRDEGSEPFTWRVCVDGWQNEMVVLSKGRKTTKSHTGQKVVERQDRPYLEGTRHLEEE